MSSYHYSFYSPTDCTAWVFSHRFHCLLSVFSHRLHRFTQKLGCLQGGALVSARLCRLPEQEVHQPNKIDILPRNPQNPQNFLLSVFSHRLHRFTQKLGCLQGGALVSSAPTKQYRYTSCYVGALETSAPPEVSRFCEFCVFCGRHFAVAEAGDLRYYLPHPNHLCRSVKSVGGHCLLGWCT